MGGGAAGHQEDEAARGTALRDGSHYPRHMAFVLPPSFKSLHCYFNFTFFVLLLTILSSSWFSLKGTVCMYF